MPDDEGVGPDRELGAREGAAGPGPGPDPGPGPGPGRRRRARRGEGERLREEIVTAASRMLAETGEVGELSLRSVAREVGVATTSIYLHFPSLDELVLAVKTRYFDEFGEALAAAAGQAGDAPLARVRASAHRYVRYGLENRGRYLTMFASESLPPHLLPAVGFVGRDQFEAVRDEVAALTGPEQDADMLAIHLWTALHGIVTLRAMRPAFPWPDLDRQIDSLIDRLLPAG
ncbi:TetR/AcrR family transcriptional regulator [Rugosimonospora africana]|uniref:TetR family transcriptional regulator n=1 Tax=Rugosimonospora africana TaxID=556532 RepID=A0A8J3QQL9_9ACTN|nr:TetR/AcrR family transcriptional regulator [Rugosimonospora africana]GIH14522.1 TetR family transcriptional regulator [Rugosimonospora africana]